MTGSGNPTKSTAINNLIKEVKNKEVQKQGASSQACHPMIPVEFE